MAIDKRHIENIFGQKFSLKDQKKVHEYFGDKHLKEESKQVIKSQWEQFQESSDVKTDLDQVFYKLFYSITQEKINKQKGRSLFLRISQVAAVLIAGLLIAASIYFSDKNNPVENNQHVEFVSHSGFRNQFKLPDGTTGWLGHNSKLEYQLDENNQRVVSLDGLAFFDVARHEKQRFIVQTPTKLNVEVLGTRFNVASYAGDQTCEVVLEKGKVNINLQNGKAEEMMPNDRIFYDVKKKTMVKSVVDVKDFLAWTEGKLILNDISLEESCERISQFYNVDIELQAKNMNYQQVRLLLEDETLEEALNLLCLILPVEYQVEGRNALDNDRYSKKKIIIKNK
jgi:ferric-dicitrate binding protein FerR (iron transport regulator)